MIYFRVRTWIKHRISGVCPAPSISSTLVTTQQRSYPHNGTRPGLIASPPCTSSQSGTRRASVAEERAQARQAHCGRGWSVGAALARDSCPHPQLAASWRRRLQHLPRTSPRGRRRETVTAKPSRQCFTLFCQCSHILFCAGSPR